VSADAHTRPPWRHCPVCRREVLAAGVTDVFMVRGERVAWAHDWSRDARPCPGSRMTPDSAEAVAALLREEGYRVMLRAHP